MTSVPPLHDWRPSRCPANRAFAFTLVHDADGAYSRRLAPLFDVFDRLGLRVTASAFAFWASWARGGASWNTWRQATAAADRLNGPNSVPLCDPDEQVFYGDLAARGHEVALHTASETSSTREDTLRAFDLYASIFGRAPAVYTEHSSRSNKDALGNEGANPSSPYYCLDILRDRNPWIWIDEAGAIRDEADGRFFEVPPGAPLINRQAADRYGLPRAFIRTGRWRAGDGDGFLRGYSTANMDALERDGGIALVYVHLNTGWLDPHTGRIRADIEERLEYLAAKPGWFAPASEILDRAQAVDDLRIEEDGPTLTVRNPSDGRIDDLVLRSVTTRRDLVVGSLAPRAVRTLPLPR